MMSYRDELAALGKRARLVRFARRMSQATLAARSGVGVATVQRFERTGRASLEVALRIAMALEAAEPFSSLFQPPRYRTLDEALARPEAPQQRVRSKS
jgi:transcriptional regulator with XRE-family HTH domain